MMRLQNLKNLRRYVAPVNNAAATELFEIILFDTYLSFRLPKPNIRPESAAVLSRVIDERPFVNTVTKQKYLIQDMQSLDGLGYYVLDYYQCYWHFFKKRFFSNAYAELCFTLSGVGTTRNRETDIRDEESAFSWLHRYYSRQSFYASGSGYRQYHRELAPAETGNSFIKKNHTANGKKISIQKKYAAGQLLFEVVLSTTMIEYWLAFSKHDFVKFSFAVNQIEKINKRDTHESIKVGKNIIAVILADIQLALANEENSRLLDQRRS